MKIGLKWFLTGNTTYFEESDSLIGPQTSMLELKGLIQIRFGYPAKEVVIIYKHLLENDVRLKDIGIVSQEAANQIVPTVHVVRSGAKAEKKNAIVEGGEIEDEVEDDDEDDEDVQFFTHEDFALAMRMIGKDVPVNPGRLEEVRAAPPRSRPTFLNAVPAESVGKLATMAPNVISGGEDIEATTKRSARDPHYTMKGSRIHQIFAEMQYGLRALGAEDTYSIVYPGASEPFQYWDMRLPENALYQEEFCNNNQQEVCFELFFFGDCKEIFSGEGATKFNAVITQMLETKFGIKARTPVAPREAGCMYPLVAVAIVMTETEGMELGNAVFDEFGISHEDSADAPRSEVGAGPAKVGAGGGCGQQ